MDDDHSILWRRLDMPGHESARVYGDDDGWYLDGAAIFLQGDKPCRLEYFIECDPDWHTTTVIVDGWVGDDVVAHEVTVNEQGVWLLDDVEIPAVKGCIDIDLNFSPITNLLPVRRLDLTVGRSAEVRAAWLRFPSFELEPLEQTYTRIDDTTLKYESHNGEFVRELRINEAALVLEYPDFWVNEKSL